MSTTRLAFIDRVSVAGFSAFAEQQGWEPNNSEPTPTEDYDADKMESNWSTPVGELKFTDNTIIGCQFVDLHHAADTERLENVVRENFDCLNRSEAIDAIDLDKSDDIVRRSYRLLACLAPATFDQEIFEVTSRGLHSRRADIRESALIIPQLTAWTNFLADVIRIDEEEAGTDVQELAAGIRMRLEIRAQLEG
jgi:hypothetical protein